MAGERTEAATPKRRRDARQKGQIARSQDLTAAMALAASFVALLAGQQFAWGSLETMLRQALMDLRHPQVALGAIFTWAAPIVAKGLVALAPVCLTAAAATALTQVGQVGLLLSARPLQLDLTRLDPLQGLKRLVARRTLVELTKGLLKCALMSFILYRWFCQQRGAFIDLAAMDPSAGRVAFTALCRGLAVRVCLAFLAIGALDVLYQRLEHERNLRMSRQEVKEEHREQEGDPQIRARVRQIQRQMATRRLMQEVPKADVVVTNPTHLAVALRYDPERHAAPVVVAKGQLLMAERIRALAKRHHVPVVQNVPLARALYRQVEVGHAVPEALYRAVAEVLAFIYRTYGRKA